MGPCDSCGEHSGIVKELAAGTVIMKELKADRKEDRKLLLGVLVSVIICLITVIGTGALNYMSKNKNSSSSVRYASYNPGNIELDCDFSHDQNEIIGRRFRMVYGMPTIEKCDEDSENINNTTTKGAE